MTMVTYQFQTTESQKHVKNLRITFRSSLKVKNYIIKLRCFFSPILLNDNFQFKSSF